MDSKVHGVEARSPSVTSSRQASGLYPITLWYDPRRLDGQFA